MVPYLVTRVVNGIPMSHVALLLAFLILVFSLPALFAPRKFGKSVENFLAAGDHAMRLTGVLLILLAFFILNTHWTVKLSSNRSIMTVVGYLLALSGVIRIWFPLWTRRMVADCVNKPWCISLAGFIGLALAGGFGYLGLWVY